MKARNLKIGTRVSLAWYDAHGPVEKPWIKLEDIDLTLPPVWVCGIVVGVSKTCLAVSAAMHRLADDGQATCTVPMVLPWFAIRKLTVLKDKA